MHYDVKTKASGCASYFLGSSHCQFESLNLPTEQGKSDRVHAFTASNVKRLAWRSRAGVAKRSLPQQ